MLFLGSVCAYTYCFELMKVLARQELLITLQM